MPNQKKYDLLVYIGRFQPVHTAHAEILRQASELSDHVLVIVGSARQPRTYKNPFTSEERHRMLCDILDAMPVESGEFQYDVQHNPDTIYNDQAWAVRVQNMIYDYVDRYIDGRRDARIGIIGHKKDVTSDYLEMFPQFDLVKVPLIEPLNATDIRDLYFRRNSNLNFIRSVVPESVMDFLTEFRSTQMFEDIVGEREFIADYRKQYAGLAYPPVFVTGDAVVISSGHVLMIRRRAEPGRGLWALPGGFLNANTDRSVVDCAIRELREETGIKVPEPVLRGSIQDQRVFDAIDRSARGRTITHAVKIVLPDGPLPRVRGSDDADKAQWIPIADVRSDDVFEDHYEIIQTFLGA